MRVTKGEVAKTWSSLPGEVAGSEACAGGLEESCPHLVTTNIRFCWQQECTPEIHEAISSDVTNVFSTGPGAVQARIRTEIPSPNRSKMLKWVDFSQKQSTQSTHFD